MQYIYYYTVQLDKNDGIKCHCMIQEKANIKLPDISKFPKDGNKDTSKQLFYMAGKQSFLRFRGS